jgi:hypothetical protein
MRKLKRYLFEFIINILLVFINFSLAVWLELISLAHTYYPV